MSAILKFDFQKRKHLRFSEVNYLNYTNKTQFCMWQLHFPLNKGKQEQAVNPYYTLNLYIFTWSFTSSYSPLTTSMLQPALQLPVSSGVRVYVYLLKNPMLINRVVLEVIYIDLKCGNNSSFRVSIGKQQTLQYSFRVYPVWASKCETVKSPGYIDEHDKSWSQLPRLVQTKSEQAVKPKHGIIFCSFSKHLPCI